MSTNEIQQDSYNPSGHLIDVLDKSSAEMANYLDELTRNHDRAVEQVALLRDQIAGLEEEIRRSKELHTRIQNAGAVLAGHELTQTKPGGWAV